MKNERDFIRELELRAQAERRIVSTELVPSWARGIGEWLVVNPWRVLVPLSGIAYGIWRMAYGVGARELVLGLFGGY